MGMSWHGLFICYLKSCANLDVDGWIGFDTARLQLFLLFDKYIALFTSIEFIRYSNSLRKEAWKCIY